ncbi:MAG: DUF1614 domain-containing protein [Gammaproteobacteria bacterium]|nr:DUF1614 domain-containing protein [Gammaproteobacteria bacterium]
MSSYHFFPLAWPFLLALFLLIVVVVAAIEIGILKYAYEKMGVQPRYVLVVLVLSLLGSYVNIPVAQLPPEQVMSDSIVTHFGMQYVVPRVEQPGTIIAVNLGGAVIPALLSTYLMIKNSLYLRALAGIAIVALVSHWFAQPVPGVGIAVPIFIPPLVAVVVAWVLGRRHGAPPLAYICGSMGTLIGADLLNLGNIQGLGAPVASIGGAGTFDGIFLSGILAVLLA